MSYFFTVVDGAVPPFGILVYLRPELPPVEDARCLLDDAVKLCVGKERANAAIDVVDRPRGDLLTTAGDDIDDVLRPNLGDELVTDDGKDMDPR